MSFIPAAKYLITIPFSGALFVILYGVLKYIIPLAEESNTKTFLVGLFLIGIPFSILIGGGIRALMQYQKSKYM